MLMLSWCPPPLWSNTDGGGLEAPYPGEARCDVRVLLDDHLTTKLIPMADDGVVVMLPLLLDVDVVVVVADVDVRERSCSVEDTEHPSRPGISRCCGRPIQRSRWACSRRRRHFHPGIGGCFTLLVSRTDKVIIRWGLQPSWWISIGLQLSVRQKRRNGRYVVTVAHPLMHLVGLPLPVFPLCTSLLSTPLPIAKSEDLRPHPARARQQLMIN